MAYDFSPIKKRVVDIEAWLVKEFSGIRTGRATSAILDTLQVEAYGSYMPINQVANITNEDPRTLRIVPWDAGLTKNIEKAITSSNLGLSAAVDDKGLRLFFPELTGERRAELLKVAKEQLENARIELRKERNKTNSDIDQKKKDGEMSEDEAKRNGTELDKLVQDANKKFDEHFAKKEKEISS